MREYYVCNNCVQPLVNDDYTELDYWYNEVEADAIAHEIAQGIEALGHPIAARGVQWEVSFDMPCDICGCNGHEYLNIFDRI